MKKLVIFHTYLAPYRIDFFNSVNENFQLKVYFQYTNDPSQSFDLKILKDRVSFNYQYLVKGFKIFNRQIRLNVWSTIKKEKPDIIITHEFAFFSFFVLLFNLIHFKRYKHIITTDDSFNILNNLPWYRKVAKSILLNFIDGLITISSDSKNWHISRYPKLKKHIFDLPIIQDETVFRKKLEEAIPISKSYIDRYNLDEKKIILFVGRLVKAKGIDLLVEEFMKINDKNITLLIVGDGELKEDLQKKIIDNKEERIILTGRYDGIELIAWYNVASCFILPSLYEPFGAVVNEALISGLYVLCSKYAGSSSLINNKNNGVVFDPLQKEVMKENLILALDNIKKVDENSIVLKNNLMSLNFVDKMIEFNYFLNKI
jgi:glycosyltransferase involved in cell wall biosynthesis